jgi:hypothetical protein
LRGAFFEPRHRRPGRAGSSNGELVLEPDPNEPIQAGDRSCFIQFTSKQHRRTSISVFRYELSFSTVNQRVKLPPQVAVIYKAVAELSQKYAHKTESVEINSMGNKARSIQHPTLEAQWFRQIAMGTKKTEYRTSSLIGRQGSATGNTTRSTSRTVMRPTPIHAGLEIQHVSFETQPEVPLGATVGYATTAAIRTAEGFISTSTLGALAENIQRQVLDVLKSSSVIMSLPDGQTAAGQRQTAVLTDRPIIEVDRRQYEVNRAVVTGDVRWATVSPPNFFMLARDGEERPHVACVVGEIPGGHLVGLAFNNQGQTSVISLPVTERNRKKIFRQKLKGEGGGR